MLGVALSRLWRACGLTAAGRDDLGLPPGPVVNDLVARHGQGVIGVNVVEATQAEQDVVDCLLGVFGLEACDEQCQSLVGGATGPLFDRHQVEVIAQLAEIADRLELHGHEVAEPGDVQAVDFLGRFEEVLGPGFVGVQKLHLGGGEDSVEGSRRTLGDGERADRRQTASQLIEINALVVEEEVQLPADPVREVDGDGRATAEVCVWRDDLRDRVPCRPCRAEGSYVPGQRASGAFLARLCASACFAGSRPRVAAACSYALAGRFRLPQARPSGSKDVISRRAMNGAELATSS